MKKRIYRFLSVFLITALLTGSLAGACPIKAQASGAGAAGLTAAQQLYLTLYGAVETGMIAGGYKEGLDEYATSQDLWDAFYTFNRAALGMPEQASLEGLHVSYADGTVHYVSGGVVYTEFTDGTTVYYDLNVPGSGFQTIQVDGTVSASSEADLARAGYYTNLTQGSAGEILMAEMALPVSFDDLTAADYNELDNVVIGSGMVNLISEFVMALTNDAVVGISKDNYLYDSLDAAYFFDGLDVDADGNYIIKGNITAVDGKKYFCDTTYGSPIAGYISNGYFSFVRYTSGNPGYTTFISYYDIYDGGAYEGYKNPSAITYSDFYTNVPVFDSREAVAAFLKTGELTGYINGMPYDLQGLAESIPDTLSGLTDVALTPSKMDALTDAVGTTAGTFVPDPDADAATNSKAYSGAIAGVIDDTIADTATPDNSDDSGSTPGAETGLYSGILGSILAAIAALASQIWELFSAPIAAIQTGITSIIAEIQELIDAVPGQIERVVDTIVALPDALMDLLTEPMDAIVEGVQSVAGVIEDTFTDAWAKLKAYLERIIALLATGFVLSEVNPANPDGSGDDDENNKHSFEIVQLLNILFYLIGIVVMLLLIFIHCLDFIINIFQIKATTGYLPEDMVTGLEYLKSLEITGIGMSVYDFMMGLVYILIIFGVIRILRENVNHLKLPVSRK